MTFKIESLALANNQFKMHLIPIKLDSFLDYDTLRENRKKPTNALNKLNIGSLIK